MEGYFEDVVDTLTGAGYRWYETANFCRAADRAGGRDLRARHNLGYWLGHDYLGIGVGAVGTIAGRRLRNTPSLAGYVDALERGEAPPRVVEVLAGPVQAAERVLLGLRLDEPCRSPRSKARSTGRSSHASREPGWSRPPAGCWR